MFYDLQLLIKGGKFVTIWLAATRGIKSIEKTERNSVNVVKSCDDILSVIITDSRRTQHRFSLVLSSKLLNGLTRIHHAQVSDFLDYVNKFYFHEMQRQARLIEIFSEETTITSSLEVVKPKKRQKPRAAKPVVEFTPEEILAQQVATWFQPGESHQIAEIIEEDLPRRVLQPDDRQITLIEEVILPQTAENDEFGDFGPGLTLEEVEALLEGDWGEKRTASEEIGPPSKKKKDAIQEPIIEEPPQVIPEQAEITVAPVETTTEAISTHAQIIDIEKIMAILDEQPPPVQPAKPTRAEKQIDEEMFKVPRRVPKKGVNPYISTHLTKHNINIGKLEDVMGDIAEKEPLRDFTENNQYLKEVDLVNDIFLLFVETIADETSESRRDTVRTPDGVELRKVSSREKGARITPQQLLTPLRARKSKDIESIESPSKYKAVEDEPPRPRPIRRSILEEFEPYPQEIQRVSLPVDVTPQLPPLEIGKKPRKMRPELTETPISGIQPLPRDEIEKIELAPAIPTDQPTIIRPEYEPESRKDKLKSYAKRILSLHEKGQTHIRIPDIADKPVNRFAAASAFAHVLDLAARGYVKLFTQEGNLEFDHLEVDERLLKIVKA